MGPTILLSLLALLCLLYEVNSRLRGRATEAAGGVIGLTILLTLLGGLVFLGWRTSLLGLAAMLVLWPVASLLARPVAHRLLGYRAGQAGDEDLDIIGMLERSEGVEAAFEKLGQERAAELRKLEALAKRRSIAAVLAMHQVTVADYEFAFRRLKPSAIGDLAWEIVAAPKDLQALLQMIRDGKTDPEIWAHFRKHRSASEGQRSRETPQPPLELLGSHQRQDLGRRNEAESAGVLKSVCAPRLRTAPGRIAELRVADLIAHTRQGLTRVRDRLACDHLAGVSDRDWWIDWHKGEGDELVLDDCLVELRTADGSGAAMVLRSPLGGILVGVIATSTAPSGRIIALVDTEIGPATAKAYSLIQRGLEAWNDRTAALSCFDEALALDEGCARGWYYRAVALGDLSRWHESMAACHRAIAISAAYTAPWTQLGLSFSETGRFDDARLCFDAVLAVAPDRWSALEGKGLSLHRLQRFEEAIECFGAAAAAARDDYTRGWALNYKATSLRRASRFEDGLGCANEAIKAQSHEDAFWVTKGNCLRDLHRLEEALQCHEKAFDLAPNSIAPLYNIALVQEDLDRTDDAIASYADLLKRMTPDKRLTLDVERRLQLLQAKKREKLRSRPGP